MSKKRYKAYKSNYSANTKSHKTSKLKTFFVILGSLLATFCIAMNGWWIYIKYFMPDKYVATTYKVGMQTTTAGDNEPFIDVKLHKNSNGNGLELFEIKFNYMLDETKDALYSQGLQFSSADKNSKISWNYYADQTSRDYLGKIKGGWYSTKLAYSYFGTWEGSNKFNYMSSDKYATTLISTNPLGSTSAFKITLGDELYLMKFKGAGTGSTAEIANQQRASLKNDQTKVGEGDGSYNFYGVWGTKDYNYFYSYADVNYFAKLIYDSIKDLKAGTKTIQTFEFADIFYYYKYKGDGVYESHPMLEDEKVKSLVKSYYSIGIDIVADGAQRAAADSLFYCINGNANYNTTGKFEEEIYFVGRTVLDVYLNATKNDFIPIPTDNQGRFMITLCDRFNKYYAECKDKIVLNVIIDKDYCDSIGMEIDGIIANGYEIWQTNLDLEVVK